MCISCRLYARFLIKRKTFIVQCSYAHAAPLIIPASKSRSFGGTLMCSFGEIIIDLAELTTLLT